MSFQLSVITPAGSYFEGKAESIAAPGVLGGFEVQSGHQPMVVALKKGGVRVLQQEKKIYFTIDSGVLEVDPQHDVVLLADSIQPI